MPASAKLLSIATANAPNVMTQTDVVRVAQALFRDRFPGIDRMLPVFDTAGIRTRQSAMPLDWYLTPRSWPERTQAYLDIAVGMLARAAEAALDQAGLKGSDVDVVITVSSTGIATPSLFLGMAIVDLGWSTTAFAYVFDRVRQRLNEKRGAGEVEKLKEVLAEHAPEAVADLIDAETTAQAKQALGQLDGRLSETYAGFVVICSTPWRSWKPKLTAPTRRCPTIWRGPPARFWTD